MSDRNPQQIRRAARLVLAAAMVNVAAFAVVNVAWPDAALPMFVGWCLSWLTAVIWLVFQEARGAR